MKKVEKSLFVQNLTEELKSASSVVLINYSGLTVKMQQDLKKRLRQVEADMEVVKNNLFKLAGKEARIDENILTDTVLTGPIALIITEKDPIAPLQVLGKFVKEHEILEFKVGIVEGIFQDKESLTRLTNLPSKENLQAQIIGSLSGPLYGIVGVLQGNLQKLVYILQEVSQKQGSPS
ncbi:50S ribosomal protein L10 [Candidatus Woesebacteria bacterium RIFCSPLOWO2_01_FULL_37_19]|uniref:Large ribosomal subunit protein uL10 n=2 Tax=Candidatus Woeseibacteriota TaxID=1752722 RepID=A0A1F8BCE1_9BACT|nr:MAG: 50S ribosomal protein L10 [Candidatus Woesebacteria bacterium RIFCSPHIGHO2_01_FULL_38_26b]OGM61025.1 MAG: 50S ribosomal protein L10 [Candidatus Woesebacteria bacterium RIFCSPLOWO2_01_FULL_37_19]